MQLSPKGLSFFSIARQVVGSAAIIALVVPAAEAADVKTRSGGVLNGTVLQTVVQVCGSRAADIELMKEDDPVRVTVGTIKGDLKAGGAALLMSAQGVLIRTVPGQLVEAINELGVTSRGGTAFYLFMNGDMPAYPALTTLLGDVRDWFSVALKPDMEMLMAAFSPTTGAVGFVSGTEQLDQAKCRLVGTVLVQGGTAVRLLPILELMTTKGTVTIPIEELALVRPRPEQQ